MLRAQMDVAVHLTALASEAHADQALCVGRHLGPTKELLTSFTFNPCTFHPTVYMGLYDF